MKKLFILLACAATVVACSKDETIASFKGDAIKFGNPFVNKSTRLDTYGAGKSLTSFKVWGTVKGTSIYAATDVTGSVDGVWTANADPQYWAEDATYNFAAIADGTATTLVNELPATIDYTLSNDKDLLYATSGEFVYDPDNHDGTVKFDFEHLLSKAKFTVTSDATTGYSHKVHTISVANYKEGTYTVASEVWAVDALDAQNVAFNDITVDATAPVVSNEMLLIPVAAGFNVNFTVDFYKGTTKIHSQTYSIPCTDEFKKGHAYNFTIGLDAGDEIKFSVKPLPTWKEDPATTPVTLQ